MNSTFFDGFHSCADGIDANAAPAQTTANFSKPMRATRITVVRPAYFGGIIGNNRYVGLSPPE